MKQVLKVNTRKLSLQAEAQPSTFSNMKRATWNFLLSCRSARNYDTGVSMNERKGKEGMEGWIGWGSTVRAAAATMGDAFFLRLSVRFLVSIQVFSISLRAECRFHSEMGSRDDHSQLCIFELPTV